MLLVTESFTLIAGNSSSPRSCIWYSRCTPVVVSSDTPRMNGAIRRQNEPSSCTFWRSSASTTLNSSFSVESGSGSVPSFS